MTDPRDFGAVGDGVHDDTGAVRAAIESGAGGLTLSAGDYLLSETVTVDLARHGRFGLDGQSGGAKVIMAGAGPAFHLIGSHEGSADPTQFSAQVWSRERMPLARDLEIEGRHPEADGFLVEGTMQSSFHGVLLRGLRHGIRVYRRARNLLISHCHVYDNSGVGIYLDRVNLHQAIVTGSHISYCRRGGIRVEGSQLRNLQVTGNDIEYNFDPEADRSADIWIDSSHPDATVREGTIVSNTIQALYSPGGANVLMLGQDQADNKAGLFTISNNLIGTQETNIHLVSCRGVVLNGNAIYGGRKRNVLVERCQNVVMTGNVIEHNPDYNRGELCTGVTLVESKGCALTGCVISDAETTPSDGRNGLLEIEHCQRVTVNACQITDGYPRGLFIRDSHRVMVTGCTIVDTREPAENQEAVLWKGAGEGNRLSGNSLGGTRAEAVVTDPASGVTVEDNIVS